MASSADDSDQMVVVPPFKTEYLVGALVVCLSTAIVSEFLIKYFITNTDLSRRQRSVLQNTGKHLAKLDDGKDSSSNKAKDNKPTKRLKRELMIAFQELQRKRMYGQFLSVITYVVAYFTFRGMFEGVAVATFPFVPFSSLHWLTSIGLEGGEPSQCSFGFMLILCAFFTRASMKKLFGNDVPRLQGVPTILGMPISSAMQKSLNELQ